MGTTMDSLGRILGTLLSALGTLVGVGGELGSVILPPLASVLHVLADVLQVVAPILPGVALGFAAWKVAALIAPMLGTLAGQLDTIGIKALMAVDNLALTPAAGAAAATGFGLAADGARGLEAAMGPIMWILAGIGLVIPTLITAFGSQDKAQDAVKKSADAMRQALQASKGAIDDNVRAVAAKTAQDAGILAMAPKWGVAGSTIVNAMLGQKDALQQVRLAAEAYNASQAAQSQAAYKNADGSYQSALAAGTLTEKTDDNTRASKDAFQAILANIGITSDEIDAQHQLKDALDGSGPATRTNAERLQGLATPRASPTPRSTWSRVRSTH
jgi:hypothetical protein